MQIDIATQSPPSGIEPLIIVEEISHRVVNEYTQAIAGIRLAAAELASHEARDALISAAKRLLTYADAHKALLAPPAGQLADLGAYLDRLGAALTAASLKERGIRLTLVKDPVTLAPERCWRVALIISELITNSVRHSLRNGPGDILVEVLAGEAQITCRVSDDGRSPGVRIPGRGVGIIHGLAAELGGAVVWSCRSGGATAELVMPCAVAELRP